MKGNGRGCTSDIVESIEIVAESGSKIWTEGWLKREQCSTRGKEYGTKGKEDATSSAELEWRLVKWGNRMGIQSNTKRLRRIEYCKTTERVTGEMKDRHGGNLAKDGDRRVCSEKIQEAFEGMSKKDEAAMSDEEVGWDSGCWERWEYTGIGWKDTKKRKAIILRVLNNQNE